MLRLKQQNSVPWQSGSRFECFITAHYVPSPFLLRFILCEKWHSYSYSPTLILILILIRGLSCSVLPVICTTFIYTKSKLMMKIHNFCILAPVIYAAPSVLYVKLVMALVNYSILWVRFAWCSSRRLQCSIRWRNNPSHNYRNCGVPSSKSISIWV